MIIVFGGSFNPVTKAHVKIYEYLKEKFPPFKFIVLPTSFNYTWKKITNDTDRYNMLKLAFDNEVVIDKKEMNDTSYKGTYHYLKSLNEKDVYFLLGADNILDIKKWIDYEKLIKEFKFIVLSRNDINIKDFILNDNFLKEYYNNFIIIDDFNNNISSSEFRKTHNKDMVPEKVYEYIKSNKLYEV